MYFYSNHISGKVIVRPRYEGKIETEGTSMNHSITITSLTVDHSGVFTCVYKKSFDHRVVQRLHRFHTCVFFLLKMPQSCPVTHKRVGQVQCSAYPVPVTYLIDNPYLLTF